MVTAWGLARWIDWFLDAKSKWYHVKWTPRARAWSFMGSRKQLLSNDSGEFFAFYKFVDFLWLCWSCESCGPCKGFDGVQRFDFPTQQWCECSRVTPRLTKRAVDKFTSTVSNFVCFYLLNIFARIFYFTKVLTRLGQSPVTWILTFFYRKKEAKKISKEKKPHLTHHTY
jgi:hypothetical protein